MTSQYVLCNEAFHQCLEVRITISNTAIGNLGNSALQRGHFWATLVGKSSHQSTASGMHSWREIDEYLSLSWIVSGQTPTKINPVSRLRRLVDKSSLWRAADQLSWLITHCASDESLFCNVDRHPPKKLAWSNLHYLSVSHKGVKRPSSLHTSTRQL
jgi:hypothetical protein